jgi:chromosome segregation protein
LTAVEAEKSLQQETLNRLLKEQREKQRQLDKLEATKQAQQEAQGTYATKIILQSDLPGVCGLVAQLGQVEPHYQLALEIAAGARLGYIVVEDDSIAAAGIELLKHKKAGRTTFLPLNKIQIPRTGDISTLKSVQGFINLAVNLIEYQPKYRSVFAYVFGSTVVFDSLDNARYHLGKFRMVTLEGEILETSGAMTGGSKVTNSAFHFGTASSLESEEGDNLKKRLKEIEGILDRIDSILGQKNAQIKQLNQVINETRQATREQQLRLEQSQKENDRLTQQKQQVTPQVSENRKERERVENRLLVLGEELPIFERQLQEKQSQLVELEKSHIASEWQEIQNLIEFQEQELQRNQQLLFEERENLKQGENQYLRIGEKRKDCEQKLAESEENLGQIINQSAELSNYLKEIEKKIAEKEGLLEQLGAKIATAKRARDLTETNLRELQNQRQQKTWQLQKLEELQEEKQTTLSHLEEQIVIQKEELPEPLPEVPLLVADENMESGGQIAFDSLTAQLEQLQKEIRSAQKRLESLEPVNMLALEEYEQTKARLDELSSKLTTLSAERNELLLRAENFTTLRYRAFKEAFDAVNENFKTIFATLSEGDGYLQLDNPESPFDGGLNLVAHPKGKPVQRLSSMSGGEKSLTALSFIFALQRYRPSPFYAFDEVDMFLDGANVERLAKMIKQQAGQAQFIVVSLRRPMIEASERTIGVTQARGAYTQVLGIKL